MNKKEIAKEFTKQMLDPNQPSINFGQVTNMLKEIEQAHAKVQSDMESYLIKHRMLGYAFSDRHSQLESLKEQLEKLNEQLTESSIRISEFRRSSLWQRYWTAIVVGIVSALLTNLVWMIIS